MDGGGCDDSCHRRARETQAAGKSTEEWEGAVGAPEQAAITALHRPPITRNPSHTSCFPLPGVLAPSHLPVFSPTATTAPLGWKSAQRPVSWERGEGEFKQMPFK